VNDTRLSRAELAARDEHVLLDWASVIEQFRIAWEGNYCADRSSHGAIRGYRTKLTQRLFDTSRAWQSDYRR
jgi:hypothetical protein